MRTRTPFRFELLLVATIQWFIPSVVSGHLLQDMQNPSGDTGSVTIKIRTENHSPFPGVKVFLRDSEKKGPRLKQSTDLRGEAVFQDLPVGVYSIKLTFPGYYIIRDEVVLTHDALAVKRLYAMEFQYVIPLIKK